VLPQPPNAAVHTGGVATTDFHPDLRSFARFAPREPIRPSTLKLARGLAGLIGLRQPRDVEVLTIAAGTGVRLHRPVGVTEPAPALLWLHGGGYVIGTAAQDDALCRRFARILGITVASVEYRLAPEHPYPAPLDDCYAALQWLVGLPAVDPTRVAIGGASAGGGLTAALALRARDRGEVTPVLQLLVYPMLDDRSATRLGVDNSSFRLWNQSANGFGWKSYLGGADPAVAVPARHDDLAGLPPAWLGVGTLDLFHDEDLAYAERLNRAGTPCQTEVVAGAFHGFDGVVPKADVSRAFFASQCEALRQAFV
jgi:acetyl esterase/lipase